MADLPQRDAPAVRRRRGYLDWLRGVAVLIMIEGHLFDSWTRAADRETAGYRGAIVLAGIGAPLFLFLAGVAVSMSAGSKLRRSGDAGSASAAVVRRGAEIFGLAFLFRAQAWILGQSSPRALLKVDILNIMGPSIMAAAALWGAATTKRGRVLLLLTATLGISLLTPVLREAWFIVALPQPLEAYFRPVPGMTNFVFLPWAGFVLAGALTGLFVDEARTAGAQARLNLLFGLAGAAIAAGAYGLSHLPSPYASSYFWTTSPAYFFLRVGLMLAVVAFAYAWERRPNGATRWSPVRQLGETSLFIYWIHVEMIYGLVSRPLHGSLSFGQAAVALAAFTGFMLICSLAKQEAVSAWSRRRARLAERAT